METTGKRRNLLAFVIVAVLGGFLAIWTLKAAEFLPSLTSEYRIKAVAPTAANLTAGARVTAAGARVGYVTSIERRGMGAIVEMEIEEDGVGPLPRDTTISVRQRTPVGENYVELRPGDASETLESGSVLPMEQPDDYVELDQVLSSLQGGTRERARDVVQSLGATLDGRGTQLNQLLSGATGVLQPMTRLAAVAGPDRQEIKRLIASLGSLMGAVGERQAAVRQISTQGLTTVEAIGSRDAKLRELLRTLPSTLTQVRETTGTLSTVTRQATPVVLDLSGALDELRPVIDRLEPAANVGTSVVSALGRAIDPLKRTLAEVRAVSGPAASALPSLRTTFCQANPMLRYINRYRADLTAAAQNLGSAVNSYDSIGHLARVSAVTGENAAVALPDDVSEAALELFHSGLLSELQGLTNDPYPKPGSIGQTGLPPENERLLTRAQLAASDYEFPRIHADC